MQTIDQRVSELELALKTAIVFNLNAASVLGRRISTGNPAIAEAIADDLRKLKAEKCDGIDNDLHKSYIDNLIQAVTKSA